MLLQRSFGAAAPERYADYAVLLTGLTGIFAMFPMIFLYRRDQMRRIAGGVIAGDGGRRLKKIREMLLLLGTGAGLAQAGNMIMALLQMFFDNSSYAESMAEITEGKGIGMLVFWVGIVAPIAEEMVFRWAVYLRLRDYLKMTGALLVSAVAFGAYHGNWVQFLYASALGVMFALFLEKSGNLWSCVLLHIGANVWSLLMERYGRMVLERFGFRALGLLYALFLAVIVYFITGGKHDERKI